ncbi:MAG: tetratricopeptide repeat protein [Bacteroidales bacterium]|nr:tetratricopeptide repeat protein [Bacteroidales bacterium]
MLKIINENRLDEVVITSLIRLLVNCPDDKKWETILKALQENSSPLVRSAAANTLSAASSDIFKKALLNAVKDESRLVRISAASSLAAYDPNSFLPDDKALADKATEEYMNSLVTRPDDWSAHYNKGIFHQNRGESHQAIESYETAARLYPQSLLPLINSSILYSYSGNHTKAEENLGKVLKMDPGNEAANLNMGLLLAEQGRMEEAEKALLTALTTNPEQAVAAYNLSVICSQKSMDDALKYAAIAAEAAPENPKYPYTLAYYKMQNNQEKEAENILKQVLDTNPEYLYAVSLLAEIYIKDGRKSEAEKLFTDALNEEGISENDRQALREALNSVRNSQRTDHK